MDGQGWDRGKERDGTNGRRKGKTLTGKLERVALKEKTRRGYEEETLCS